MSINRNKTLDNAQKLIQKGQIDKAIKEYIKLLENDPKKDVRTLLKLGDLYSKKGDIGEAKEIYKKVARYYSDEGFYLKAIAVYKQILKSDSANAVDIYLKLGELYQQLGLTTDSVTNYNIVAEEYEKKGMRSESIDLYKKISELNPDRVLSKLKLVDLFLQEGHIDQAKEELKASAISLKEKERDEDLLKILEKLFQIDSENLGVIKEISELYLKLHEPKKALSALQSAYRKDHENTEILGLLANSFFALEQPDKAKSVYEEMKKLFEDRNLIQEAREVGKKIMELEGKFSVPATEDEATMTEDFVAELKDDEFAIEDIPVVKAEDDVDITSTTSSISRLITEADVYAKYDLNEKAIERLRDVLLENPDSIEAHIKIKDLYVKMNRLDEAKNELFILVDIHEKAKNKEQVVQLLKELSTIDPENISVVKRIEQFETQNDVKEINIEGTSESNIESSTEAINNEFVFGETKEEIQQDVAKIDNLFDINIDTTLDATADTNIEKNDYLKEIGDFADFSTDIKPASNETPPLDKENDISLSSGIEIDFEIGNDFEQKIESEKKEPIFDDLKDLLQAGEKIEVQIKEEKPAESDFIELEIPDIDVQTTSEIEESVFTPNKEAKVAEIPHKEDSIISDSKINNFIIDLDIQDGIHDGRGEGAQQGGAGEDIPEISSDLLEAEFFIEQGLLDEAKSILNPLSIIYPSEKNIKRLMERLEGGGGYKKEEKLFRVETSSDDRKFFDFASEIKKEINVEINIDSVNKLEKLSPHYDEDYSGKREDFHETLSLYKKGIKERIDVSDSETHFNLGTAFKGMALYAEAIDEFLVAMQYGNNKFECSLEIGECYFKKGDTDKALQTYRGYLEDENISKSEKFEICNAIGKLHESGGDFKLAVKYYNLAQEIFPDSRAVVSKIEQLSSLSREEREEQTNSISSITSRKRQEKRSKISYI